MVYNIIFMVGSAFFSDIFILLHCENFGAKGSATIIFSELMVGRVTTLYFEILRYMLVSRPTILGT